MFINYNYLCGTHVTYLTSTSSKHELLVLNGNGKWFYH